MDDLFVSLDKAEFRRRKRQFPAKREKWMALSALFAWWKWSQQMNDEYKDVSFGKFCLRKQLEQGVRII